MIERRSGVTHFVKLFHVGFCSSFLLVENFICSSICKSIWFLLVMTDDDVVLFQSRVSEWFLEARFIKSRLVQLAFFNLHIYSPHIGHVILYRTDPGSTGHILGSDWFVV